jgi:hypothetical protein
VAEKAAGKHEGRAVYRVDFAALVRQALGRPHPMRSPALLILLTALGAVAAEPYRSPYEVKFTFPEEELIGDLNGARGDWKNQARVPYAEWSSAEILKRYGSWGPPAQQFAPPPGLEQKSAEWLRQRIIATGLRFRGYRYQHHHIPDWEPPAGWPLGKAELAPAKGIDCSNFTAFVYNQALGLKATSDIHEQAAMTEVASPGADRHTPVTRIERPAGYADFARVLKTGDLLFICGKAGGDVTHVVLWVGAIGQSRDQVPLILDSTGGNRQDENGAAIPDGVEVRPFTPTSWYFRCASHALRLIPD